jgi:hypothetical protein
MSDFNKTGGPAFPTPTPFADEGMTKREWYAGMALMGLLACPNRDGSYVALCESAFMFGDQMLKESNK